MLRKIRILLAVLFFILITSLFVDFTGVLSEYLGWMAKIQFLPALLALNMGIVITLIVLTLIFGRVYCSVICPLGVFQDLVSWLASKRKKHRFTYKKPHSKLRFIVLAVFILLMALGGASIAALISPYSAYGRMAYTLFAALCQDVNSAVLCLTNPVAVVALLTFIILFILAWRGGRIYCNSICPVGTVLGFLSRYSWLKPVIDADRCVNCQLCSKNCKASCIDIQHHAIDYSRCVACMDCIDQCRKGAIRYIHPGSKTPDALEKTSFESQRSDTKDSTGTADFQDLQDLTDPANSKTPKSVAVQKGRRDFLTVAALFTAALTLKAQRDRIRGNIARVSKKIEPPRKTPILPPGALSAQHMAHHCTECQLCVSNCPQGILVPSTSLMHLMRPEISYEANYCKAGCTSCADVCPTGAIQPLTPEEKKKTRIGRAEWIQVNCLITDRGRSCGKCARRCPEKAIQMKPKDLGNRVRRVPVINPDRCIGCGLCEYICPATPKAIYVEGLEHQTKKE